MTREESNRFPLTLMPTGCGDGSSSVVEARHAAGVSGFCCYSVLEYRS